MFVFFVLSEVDFLFSISSLALAAHCFVFSQYNFELTPHIRFYLSEVIVFFVFFVFVSFCFLAFLWPFHGWCFDCLSLFWLAVILCWLWFCLGCFLFAFCVVLFFALYSFLSNVVLMILPDYLHARGAVLMLRRIKYFAQKKQMKKVFDILSSTMSWSWKSHNTHRKWKA